MPVPIAFVASSAALIGTVTAVRAVRRTIARGERRLAARRARDEAEVYDLEHDAATDTYRARPVARR